MRNVNFMRGGHEILRQTDLCAPMGEITVLFGPSGAGKTTCLRLIAGLENPEGGFISINGQEVSSVDECQHPAKRRIGYCFQDDALWPALTVVKHLSVTLKSYVNDASERREKIGDLLYRFGLSDLADRYPVNLSGGEKKRLALARALAVEPDVLLLDEPLSSIDGPARNELITYLRRCKADSRTVIAVTHQLDEVYALGDYLVILIEGNLVQQGLIRDVVLNPQTRQAALLLGYKNFFLVKIENNMIISELGQWPVDDDYNGAALAAWFAEDFIAAPADNGSAQVESCQPEARRYRIGLSYGNNRFELLSDTVLQTGEKINFRVTQKPVIIKGD